jgi:ADP-ribosylglycohydrolase
MLTQPSDELAGHLVGAYLGAAAGDALGGPIEGWHHKRISATHGRVDTFYEYDPARLHPGAALHTEPGSITDDTYIRTDFTHFVLAHPTDRAPEVLASYLLENAHFDWWWPPALEPLKRIKAGEVTPREAGQTHEQGGGAGWWTAFGLIRPGQLQEAAAEVRELSVIWKQPLEQYLCGAIQAGTAAAVVPGATVSAVVDAAKSVAGPLGAKLIQRGEDAARAHADDLDGLLEEVYAHLLVDEVTGEMDGELPKPGMAPLPDVRKTGILFAEQVPLAVAAFVFGEGDFLQTMSAVVAMGRDTDSIATSCGTWIGGLVGLSGIPDEWVSTLVSANPELDLLGDARALADLASANFQG